MEFKEVRIGLHAYANKDGYIFQIVNPNAHLLVEQKRFNTFFLMVRKDAACLPIGNFNTMDKAKEAAKNIETLITTIEA